MFLVTVLTDIRCQNVANDTSLGKMKAVLLDAYMNDTSFVNCMLERMQADKTVTELYKAVTSGKKRDMTKIESYLQSVEFRCVHLPILFTPLGLAALLSVVIVLSACTASVVKSVSK